MLFSLKVFDPLLKIPEGRNYNEKNNKVLFLIDEDVAFPKCPVEATRLLDIKLIITTKESSTYMYIHVQML